MEPVDHYERGLEARRAGKLETASEAFEAALRRSPEDADVLLQLGIVYGWQGRDDEALRVLRRALEIAPDYPDVHVQLGRVLLRRDRTREAIAHLDAALRSDPERLAARVLRARARHRAGRGKAARRDYRAVLARDAEHHDALLGLGDLAVEDRDYSSATDFYRRALRAHAGSEKARERLRRILPEDRWQLTGTLGYSGFDDPERDPWWRGAVDLGYWLDPATRFLFRSETEDRGFARDEHFAASADRRFSERFGAELRAGVTAEPDFREDWSLASGLRFRLREGEAPLGATWTALHGEHAVYSTGSVETLAPSVSQQLASGRLRIDARWLNVWDEGGRYEAGWVLRAGGRPHERVVLHAGLSRAPETQEGETVDTTSVFAHVAFDLTDHLTLRLAYGRHDREETYVRHAVTLGLSGRF